MPKKATKTVCVECGGAGSVYRRPRTYFINDAWGDKIQKIIPGGIDACQACTARAELEYQSCQSE